jgi:hypothetical protein
MAAVLVSYRGESKTYYIPYMPCSHAASTSEVKATMAVTLTSVLSQQELWHIPMEAAAAK